MKIKVGDIVEYKDLYCRVEKIEWEVVFPFLFYRVVYGYWVDDIEDVDKTYKPYPSTEPSCEERKGDYTEFKLKDVKLVKEKKKLKADKRGYI